MNARDSARIVPSALIAISTILLSTVLTFSSASARDVTFAWTQNQVPVTGYKLYYKTGSNAADPFTGTGIIEGNSPIIVGNTATFTVTGLSDNETYQFALTAYSDTGESGYSDIVTISPLTTKNVSFAWSPSSVSVTGYKLYYKLGGTPVEPFNGTGLAQGGSPILIGDVTNYTVTGLDPDQTYYFALTAYDATGESDYSDVVTISATPVPVILDIRKH